MGKKLSALSLQLSAYVFRLSALEPTKKWKAKLIDGRRGGAFAMADG
jgi:hypothetical protein